MVWNSFLRLTEGQRNLRLDNTAVCNISVQTTGVRSRIAEPQAKTGSVVTKIQITVVINDGIGLNRYTLKTLIGAWALIISNKGYMIKMVTLRFTLCV